MTRVSWDAVPLPVRQFLETHANGSDGVAIVNNGSTIYSLVSARSTLAIPEWSESLNERRMILIEREIDRIATPEELSELAGLQESLRRHVDRVAPLPMEFVRNLEAELLAKAASRGSLTIE